MNKLFEERLKKDLDIKSEMEVLLSKSHLSKREQDKLEELKEKYYYENEDIRQYYLNEKLNILTS